MKQPRLLIPPATEAERQSGRRALLKHMTVEGRQYADDFWEARKHPNSTASAK